MGIVISLTNLISLTNVTFVGMGGEEGRHLTRRSCWVDELVGPVDIIIPLDPMGIIISLTYLRKRSCWVDALVGPMDVIIALDPMGIIIPLTYLVFVGIGRREGRRLTWGGATVLIPRKDDVAAGVVSLQPIRGLMLISVTGGLEQMQLGVADSDGEVRR